MNLLLSAHFKITIYSIFYCFQYVERINNNNNNNKTEIKTRISKNS